MRNANIDFSRRNITRKTEYDYESRLKGLKQKLIITTAKFILSINFIKSLKFFIF